MPIPDFPVTTYSLYIIRVRPQGRSLSFAIFQLHQDPPAAQVPGIGDDFKKFNDGATNVGLIVFQTPELSPKENI